MAVTTIDLTNFRLAGLIIRVIIIIITTSLVVIARGPLLLTAFKGE
jgi:hypothetical protein